MKRANDQIPPRPQINQNVSRWQIIRQSAGGRRPTHFEVETRYDGELLHCQLFGGLLVAMATAALDFGTASEMLGPGEPAARGDKKKRGRACVSVCTCVKVVERENKEVTKKGEEH